MRLAREAGGLSAAGAADHEQAGVFALRAGVRLQRDLREPGDLRQHVFEPLDAETLFAPFAMAGECAIGEAETALNGENTFVARMNGTAEQTARQSDYRTIQRVQ